MGLKGNLKSERVLVDEMIGRRTKIREVYCESLTCTRCNTSYMHRFLADQSHINAVCPRCGCDCGIIQMLWKNGQVLTGAVH